ncbi:MAG: hypothetical protein IKB25_09415 [Lentisphaeria bacterium]|nr:hypothetical protein [Lentisphaeria bacterium]
MDKEKKKKLIIAASAVLAALVVGGVLMAIPATREILVKPVVLKEAPIRPVDVAFDKFKKAENARKSSAMLSAAKEVYAEDKTLGKDLLKRTAFFAAVQQQKEVFAEIHAILPEVKEYEIFLSNDQKSSRSMLPELVEVNSNATLASLTENQQPVWSEQIVQFYDKMSVEDAKKICIQVNDSRTKLDESGLLSAAQTLTKYTAKQNIPVQYTVKELLQECADLAELHNNKTEMEKLVALCKEHNLLESKTVSEYEKIARGLGKTRGYDSSWDNDYESSYSKTKSKGVGIAIGVIIAAIFILIILYYILKILFGIALICGIIAIICALCA